jgi:hypothetical protein
MVIGFLTRKLTFPSVTGSSQTKNEVFVFTSTVTPGRAAACIAGLDVQYTGEDHHIGELRIQIIEPVTVSGPTVTVAVDYLLRDASGSVDDPYQGPSTSWSSSTGRSSTAPSSAAVVLGRAPGRVGRGSWPLSPRAELRRRTRVQLGRSAR